MADYDRFEDLDDTPLGETGAAAVYRVRDPQELRFDGVVAAKFLKDFSEGGKARFAREIEVGTRLDHPNVMPLLQWSEVECWFTMPVAEHTLERARPKDTDELVALVSDVCAGLAAAHARGLIHRDLKPSNVLWLGNHWVVGDWGLVRRPRGETTFADRTKAGALYGTESWAAPEQFSDAHEVSAAADVYALGCLVGWAVTGNKPTMLTPPALPAAHPLFHVVRKATQQSADRRYQSVTDLLDAFIAVATAEEQPRSAEDQAKDLEAQIRTPGGGSEGLESALRLARLADDSDDGIVFIDYLAKLPNNAVDYCCEADRALSIRLAERMGHWVCELDWGYRDFNYASTPMAFILQICRFACRRADLEALAIAADSLFLAESQWNRFATQDAIYAWLVSIRDDDIARTVASALRQHPAVAESVRPQEASRLQPSLRSVF